MGPRETPLVGFWDRPQGELLGLLRATAAGLTSDEAKRRLHLHGPNSFVREWRFAALLSFVRFFGNPLVIMMLSVLSLVVATR
jgi:P-type Mg2+ transporter